MVISLSLGGLSAPRMLVSRLLLTDVSPHCCASRDENASQFATSALSQSERAGLIPIRPAWRGRTLATERWADPSGERIKPGPNYRRAVTRRASWIFVPAPACLKQGVVESGQTCAEQSDEAARVLSWSALASATSSSACTFGAKAANLTTDAPRSMKIARDDRELTILFS
jgi:hypothetical protein